MTQFADRQADGECRPARCRLEVQFCVEDYTTLHGNGQLWVLNGRKWEGDYVTEIIVAAIALIGTAVGSLGGILAANRLTNYRIEQLEKKVDKHNSVVERIAVVEVRLTEQQDDLARLRKELSL